MCVICYKPKGVELPSQETLINCWTRNPDGAGFMYTDGDCVVIKKGFMTFTEFYNALTYVDQRINTKDIPFVLHFRIGTQGGNIPANTHPFPISKEVKALQELSCACDVAVAHNGIISLTSSGYNYGWSCSSYPTTTTSDTMDFITEYMSLIINNGDWYKDKQYISSLELIKRLTGNGTNKFAIMSADEHVELIGNFITATDGCFYSNDSFTKPLFTSYKDISYGTSVKDTQDKKDDDDDLSDIYYDDITEEVEKYRSAKDGYYHFSEDCCPYMTYGIDDYCFDCIHFAKCYMCYDDVDEKMCSNFECRKCKYRKECPNSCSMKD